jgi:RNase H
VTRRSALELHAYADGGSRGNPGPAAYGWCLVTPEGDLRQEGWGTLGVCTNNEAEYAAACEAAEAAKRAGVTALVLHMDSRLVIEQLTRALGLGPGWDTSAPHLVPYQERFARAVAGLLPLLAGPPWVSPRLSLVWIPREHNRHADGLVDRALSDRYEPLVDGCSSAPTRSARREAGGPR